MLKSNEIEVTEKFSTQTAWRVKHADIIEMMGKENVEVVGEMCDGFALTLTYKLKNVILMQC